MGDNPIPVDKLLCMGSGIGVPYCPEPMEYTIKYFECIPVPRIKWNGEDQEWTPALTVGTKLWFDF